MENFDIKTLEEKALKSNSPLLKSLVGLAVMMLVSVNSISAQDAESLFQAGKEKFSKGDFTSAIEFYTKAIAADPKHLNAYLQRGSCYIQIKKYDEAVKDYSFVINEQPNQLWAYLSRGSAYNKLEQYGKAINDFDKVLAIDENNQDAYNNRGWAKKLQGDKEGACKDWKKSKKLGNEEAKIIMKNNKCK